MTATIACFLRVDARIIVHHIPVIGKLMTKTNSISCQSDQITTGRGTIFEKQKTTEYYCSSSRGATQTGFVLETAKNCLVERPSFHGECFGKHPLRATTVFCHCHVAPPAIPERVSRRIRLCCLQVQRPTANCVHDFSVWGFRPGPKSGVQLPVRPQ